MKKLIIATGIVVLAVILAGCTGSQPQIGIMNMDKVLDESQRAQELKDQLSNIGNQLEEKYNKLDQESDDKDKENKLDSVYKEFLDNKQDVEDQLNTEINDILAEITKKNKIDIVLYKKDVHYGGQDLTEQVIKKLDEKYYKGGVEGKDEE